MGTLFLNPQTWDLAVSTAGNIATTADNAPVPSSQRTAYGLAQDAASAIRLFAKELWFDTTQGIPYFTQVLAQRPPLALVKAYAVAAALTVPGVVSAVCYISSFTNRGVTGQVQITDSSGNTAAAAF
jgi:hypothetical protein